MRNSMRIHENMNGKVRGDSVLIYHAMTPPTKKLRHEIEALRRQR